MWFPRRRLTVDLMIHCCKSSNAMRSTDNREVAEVDSGQSATLVGCAISDTLSARRAPNYQKQDNILLSTSDGDRSHRHAPRAIGE